MPPEEALKRFRHCRWDAFRAGEKTHLSGSVTANQLRPAITRSESVHRSALTDLIRLASNALSQQPAVRSQATDVRQQKICISGIFGRS
jgi:hypothetical protein